MLVLETALERILAAIPPPEAEQVLVKNAHRRILAADIVAASDLPAFDNSSMDGYAVRSADLTGAGPESPVALHLAGAVAAGGVFAGAVQRGQCVRVFTGSPMPPGADVVVMQEETRLAADNRERVVFGTAAEPGEHVRRRGEDIRAGARVLAAGQEVGAGTLSVLAALNFRFVSVARRPRVALLATGSELREAGEVLAPGQVFESNRVTLAALLVEAGAVVRVWPLVPDARDATRAALEQAFSDCDLVVTSGGVSVGEFDFVKAAFEDMGGRLEFWKVAMKPGKPFVLGRWREKCLFGLPGNPVSALVTSLLLVRPAVRRWQGARVLGLPVYPGLLAEAVANRGDRRHFMRVRLDEAGRVCSAGAQASHSLGALVTANALLDVPPDTVWPPGTSVRVLRWCT